MNRFYRLPKLQFGRRFLVVFGFVLITLFVCSFGFPVLVAADQELFFNGVSAYKSKDYDQAIQLFNQVVDKDSKLSGKAHLYLARSFVQQKDWYKALIEVLKAKDSGLSEKDLRIAKITYAYILTYGGEKIAKKAKKSKPWRLYFSAIEEYARELPELITAANAFDPDRKDDFRTVLNVGGDYRFDLGSKASLTAGYGFSQSLHADFEEYDLQRHLFTTRTTYIVNRDLRLNFDYGYTFERLDNEDFQDEHSTGINAFFRETGSLFSGVGWRYEDGDNEFNSTQSAKMHTVYFNQYWYFPNMKDYLYGGYLYSDSNAGLARWDYDLNQFYFGANYSLSEKDHLSGTLYFSFYDYEGKDTLETTKSRDDDLFGFNLKYSRDLTDWSNAFLQYSLNDSDSNITRQDYTGQVISVGTNFVW